MGFLRAVAYLAALSCITATKILEIKPDGTEMFIESKNYPGPIPPNTKQSWELKSPAGTRVKLHCYEIRLLQDHPPSCDKDLMIIEGGDERLELCGQHYGLSVLGKENRMYLELTTGPEESGGVQCVTHVYRRPTTTPKPEIHHTENRIDLEAGGKPHVFNSQGYPKQPPDYIKDEWHFTTDPHSAIRITCTDLRLLQLSEGECGDTAFTVTDSAKTQVLCGSKSGFTTLSSSNKISVSYTSGMYGRGGFLCMAQGRLMDSYGEVTTTTTTVPPYLDIPSEEIDSSEHGGKPGRKSTNCPCGWANKQLSKVVNGVETGINEFPFMAAIIDRNREYQFCGGSIITPYHVLTAAHCTVGYILSGKPISVVIGDHNLYINNETSATKTIDVERIIQHEDYNYTLTKHDISLLLLAEKIEFSKFVGPVCLSPVQLEIPRQYVKIIGWGNLKWGGPAPDVLQKVNVRVLHRNSCHKVFYTVDEVNPTQICTYSSKKASCQGDSGGPVIYLDPELNRYVLVGAVSFGTVCADENPSVHTDVPAYYDWIQKNIRESMPQDTCSKKD